jgi:MFS superfamily sulfate permease-like transporter
MMVLLETVAVARQVRRPDEPAIDNDGEVAAVGLACVAGALFRAMPSAGGFSQTAINQSTGARTQVSELVTVALAVGCALFLGGVVADIPQATLGCLAIVAVLGLIKPAEFARFWRFSRLEFWVAVTTAVIGLVLGLLAAVIAGVVHTLFLVLRALDRIGLTELQPTAGDLDLEVAGPTTAPAPGLLVLRLDGPLYAANVRSVNRKVVAAASDDGVDVLVVDVSSMAGLPLSVVDEFPELDHELSSLGVTLWIASMTPAVLAVAQQLPLWRSCRTKAAYIRRRSRLCVRIAPADAGVHQIERAHRKPRLPVLASGSFPLRAPTR